MSVAVVASIEDIREQARAYLASSLGQPVSDHLDVFAAGLANSLFAAQLVLFVEDRFAVTVEDDELEIASFASVDAVTAFVAGKTGVGGGH
ncbi:methoxymalonate biosynthesis acyl carrier protein [Streptacidiphilus sp. MAP12-20]|uniref:acyl carrier protein n=1 Tax=Streptacidiphilus sp. MAP12-20 TaxID=3156299 RepID=UPI003518E367